MFSYPNLKKLLLGIFFALSISLPAFAKDLIVSYIDIGQGDSELIELPDGKNILIDAGDKEGSARLISYLRERKIKKLDLVIISHPHLDHYGGLLQAAKTIPIELVLDSGAPTSSTTYLKLLQEFSAKKVKFKISRKGEQYKFGNDILLDILAPQDPLFKDTRSDINNSSIVARLTYNKISFLFTGDIEAESQDKMLLENPAMLKADILKVAHHGSRHTNSPEFLKAVSPKIAVISCGNENSYGHPHKETLDRLKASRATVYRTDQKGTVIVSSDGETYKITNKNTGLKIKNQNYKVDLNIATPESLELIPGFNAAKAASLVKMRPIKDWIQLNKLKISADEMKQIKKLAYIGKKPVKTSQPSESKEKSKREIVKVDLNKATLQELIALPDIGKKTAERIIAGRPYKTVEDLEKVAGIEKNRLKKIIKLFSVN